MTAVATKPRARKAATASISSAVPLVYMRPVQHYVAASTDTPVAQRIETLRASLYEADEKIEQAYDAAEQGSPVDLLLDHIGHELLADAVRPILQREDDFTGAKADAARSALFTVLAALEGAMALSLGTVLSANLAEAFNLLDWATDELEDLELNRLPPGAASTSKALEADFNRGRDLAIELMEEAYSRRDDGILQDARECMRWMREGKAQDSFVAGYLDKVIEDRSLVAGFSAILSALLDNDGGNVSDRKRVTLEETQAGEVGADGTASYPDGWDGASTSSASTSGNRDQLLDDASAHYSQAAAVVRAFCNDTQKCGLVWAADSLMEHEKAALDQALRSEDLGAIQDAIAALLNIIALLAAAAHAVEGDAALVWAAHTLVGLAHSKLDQFVDAGMQK